MSGVIRQVIRHVFVRGIVQGVGYRAFVEDEAAIRGLQGWVRNRREGSVEAVFAGSVEEVATVIESCRRGPRSARVEGIEQREGTPEQLAQRRTGEKFSVLATI
jgi:acylphosphatase